MSKVFVLDTYQRPLDPVHPGRARMLLTQGKAAVWRRFPFTIILSKEFEHPEVQPLRLKLDPGSRTTGIALVNDATGEVVFAAELTHRGEAIKKSLDSRRAVRHGRRARKTRYREPRFENRRRPAGWLAPSIKSRVLNIMTWVQRLSRYAPVANISQEFVRFDMQLIDNPTIQGEGYQQGTLAGYEIRQYLLEKWNRTCAYCAAKDVPLQIEHIHPRAKGGTNRLSNLTLACEKCNTAKGTQDIAVFLKKKPDVLKRIQSQAKTPLKDAAAVNTTRKALLEKLEATGLPVECGSGGLTKFNRSVRELPKTHWLDACCVGKSTPTMLKTKGVVPLLITATGHGSRQMCLMSKKGFPRTGPKAKHFLHKFRTGDIVKAVVPAHLNNSGVHTGRMSAKAKGGFTIYTQKGKVTDIGKKYCQILQKADGYGYTQDSTPTNVFLSSLSLKA